MKMVADFTKQRFKKSSYSYGKNNNNVLGTRIVTTTCVRTADLKYGNRFQKNAQQ